MGEPRWWDRYGFDPGDNLRALLFKQGAYHLAAIAGAFAWMARPETETANA